MANENLTVKEKTQINKMEIFLKEAFCIDGDCSYIENIKVNSTLKNTTGMLFSLCDTNRGMFYITITK